MADLNIRLDNVQAVELLSSFNRRLEKFPSELIKSLVAALNKTAFKSRDEAYKIMEEHFSTKEGMKDRTLKVSRASTKFLRSGVRGRHRPLTLGWWRAGSGELEQTDSQGRPHNAAVVKILTSRGVKIVKDAFWATGRDGKRLIFKRKSWLLGGGVKALYAPHPFSCFNKSESLARLKKQALGSFEILFNELAEKKLKRLKVR